MYEIILENEVIISGLKQYGYGFVEDGKYKLKGKLSDVLDCIKNNSYEALTHNRLELDFAVDGNLTRQRITVPFEEIYQIREMDKDTILYDKYNFK